MSDGRRVLTAHGSSWNDSPFLKASVNGTNCLILAGINDTGRDLDEAWQSTDDFVLVQRTGTWTIHER
jgi:hypothetical protein